MGFTLGKLVRPRIVCATTSVEWSGVEEERSGGNDNQKPRPISKYITNEPARHAKCSAVRRRGGARVSRKPAIIVHLSIANVPREEGQKCRAKGSLAFT